MKLPADWTAEPGTGYWSHLAHLTHTPCGWRTGMAYDLVCESNNPVSPRAVVYGHRCEETLALASVAELHADDDAAERDHLAELEKEA
ncbi:hypothetical protein ACQEVF_25465 [Nonomuraea polychroma]|uniref:hypothetical protein n=1 Tax=Nonomuraea polychroma TaxID=46176 RepID=UPI003D8B4CBD